MTYHVHRATGMRSDIQQESLEAWFAQAGGESHQILQNCKAAQRPHEDLDHTMVRLGHLTEDQRRGQRAKYQRWLIKQTCQESSIEAEWIQGAPEGTGIDVPLLLLLEECVGAYTDPERAGLLESFAGRAVSITGPCRLMADQLVCSANVRAILNQLGDHPVAFEEVAEVGGRDTRAAALTLALTGLVQVEGYERRTTSSVVRNVLSADDLVGDVRTGLEPTPSSTAGHREAASDNVSTTLQQVEELLNAGRASTSSPALATPASPFIESETPAPEASPEDLDNGVDADAATVRMDVSTAQRELSKDAETVMADPDAALLQTHNEFDVETEPSDFDPQISAVIDISSSQKALHEAGRRGQRRNPAEAAPRFFKGRFTGRRLATAMQAAITLALAISFGAATTVTVHYLLQNDPGANATPPPTSNPTSPKASPGEAAAATAGSDPDTTDTADDAAEAAPELAPAVRLALEKMNEHLQAEDFHTAIEVGLTALQQDPLNALIYRSLGIAYTRLGSKTQACESYRRYLRFAPDARDRDRVETLLTSCEPS